MGSNMASLSSVMHHASRYVYKICSFHEMPLSSVSVVSDTGLTVCVGVDDVIPVGVAWMGSACVGMAYVGTTCVGVAYVGTVCGGVAYVGMMCVVVAYVGTVCVGVGGSIM